MNKMIEIYAGERAERLVRQYVEPRGFRPITF